jgi:hypothetical protein
MQYFDDVALALSAQRGGAREFATLLSVLVAAQDDVVEINEAAGRFEISQRSWKLMDDVSDYHPACSKILHGLFEGLAAGCGRHITVNLATAPEGRPPFVWSIA